MKKLLRWIGRGVLGIAAALVLWLAIGAAYEWHAAGRDASAYPAPGVLADVGGRRIHVICTGRGSPTVVLEAALGGPAVLWQQIQPAVAAVTRVCSYDRDGIGWSDESGQPRSVAGYSGDLQRALVAANERGPFVMVGHSLGGMLAVDHIRLFGDAIAGMVLLDPAHPRQFAIGSEQYADHIEMLPYFRIAPGAARLGLTRQAMWAADKLKPLPLPLEVRLAHRALTASVKGMNALRAEAEALFGLCDASLPLPSFGDRPLIVLSAARSLAEGYPLGLHEELAKLSTHGVRRTVPDASHSGLVLKPESAPVAVAAILEVVESLSRHVR